MAQIETKKLNEVKPVHGGIIPAKIKTVKTVKPVAAPKVLSVAKSAEGGKLKTVKFSHTNLKVSPRKLRLLVATVKKLSPAMAMSTLQFTNSHSARLLRDVLINAINTAKNNNQLIVDTLKFVNITVDEGQKIKRMDKAHGSRFARGLIMKRHSRLNIVLSGTIAG
ncbi:MAG: uL22 family ribosomal protein [Candidatus Shapirobacteria bacterium]|nr:uL22 family ribosomal protein [Candidatus Shapirobacteria bacterium]